LGCTGERKETQKSDAEYHTVAHESHGFKSHEKNE
jgi:hypothetical protein